jgi:ribosome-binding protein aMBF1 (putative translation factor)
MSSFVHHKHILCQADCAFGAVDLSSAVRKMHSMAKPKKPKTKPKKKPKFGKHFVLEWRLAFGLGQEELAARMGYAHSTIQRVENGINGYTQKFLEKAALVFGCHAGILLMRPPRPEEIPQEIAKTGS